MKLKLQFYNRSYMYAFQVFLHFVFENIELQLDDKLFTLLSISSVCKATIMYNQI